MCGGDDPVAGDNGAATPVTPVVTAVSNAALPRPRVRASLHATHDARVPRRHAAKPAVLTLQRQRLHI